MDGGSGLGGAAGGVEDADDGDVGVEGGEVVVGVEGAAEDGGEVVGRVVVGGGEGWGGFDVFFFFSGEADAELCAGVAALVEGVDVAGCAVDFHVFAVEGPVPGALDDGGGVRVGEDDSGVIVDVGVDLGFELLCDGGDGERELAVHDPGGEVDAVAAEVEEGTGSVEFGVSENGEELGADADLFGAAVAVVDDELAEVADFATGEDFGGGGVGVVPGGLVVGEDGDVELFGELLDGEGVVDGGGEGLFDHGGDAEGGGLLDGGSMAGDGGVDEDGLGVRGAEHLGFRGKEDAGRKVGAFDVVLAEGGIGIGDADELELGVGGQASKEAADVPVDEADDGHADGGGSLGGGLARREE